MNDSERIEEAISRLSAARDRYCEASKSIWMNGGGGHSVSRSAMSHELFIAISQTLRTLEEGQP